MLRQRLIFIPMLVLGLALLLPASAIADNYEPNNGFLNATPIQSNGTYYSYISTENDVDYYKVYLRPGNLLVRMQAPSTIHNEIQLFDASGDELTSADEYWDAGQLIEISYSVTQAGYYYIAASSPRDDYDYDNRYSLSLSVPRDTFEPNNERARAGIIVGSGTLNSYISTENDTDYYKVYMKPGNLLVRMQAPSTIHNKLQLVDAYGEELTSVDEYWDAGEQIEFSYSITRAGYYYVVASSPRDDYDYDSSYSITFLSSSIMRPTMVSIANPPSIVNYSQQVTMSGRAVSIVGVPVSGASVQPQYSYDLVRWYNLSPSITDSYGRYTFTTNPTRLTHYRVRFPGFGFYLSSNSRAVSILPRVQLNLALTSSALVNRAFAVSGYLKPRDTAGTKTVQLACYRYENGAWNWKKNVWATNSDYSSYTRFQAAVTLPYKGSWRIRAVHPASSRNALTITGWKYITVR